MCSSLRIVFPTKNILEKAATCRLHGKHHKSTIKTYVGQHWSLCDTGLSSFPLRSFSFFGYTTSCSSPCALQLVYVCATYKRSSFHCFHFSSPYNCSPSLKLFVRPKLFSRSFYSSYTCSKLLLALALFL
jgi:hypothetical protein